MSKSIYDSCLLYKTNLFGTERVKTDDILILADNDFINKKEEIMNLAKLIIKDKEYFTST